MGLFTTREPRRFRGVHIYTSERKDKLDKLVEEAKREEMRERGEHVEYTPDIESYRGKFVQNSCVSAVSQIPTVAVSIRPLPSPSSWSCSSSGTGY